jgi:hypothetical protein
LGGAISDVASAAGGILGVERIRGDSSLAAAEEQARTRRAQRDAERLKALADYEYEGAKALWSRSTDDYVRSLRNTTEPPDVIVKNWDAFYKSTEKNIMSQVLIPDSQAAVERYLMQEKVKWDDTIKDLALDLKVSQLAVQYANNAVEMVKTASTVEMGFGMAQAALLRAVDDRIMTQQQADWHLAIALQEAAPSDYVANADQWEKYLDALTPEDKARLRSRAQQLLNAQQSTMQKQRMALEAQMRKEGTDLIVQGDPEALMRHLEVNQANYDAATYERFSKYVADVRAEANRELLKQQEIDTEWQLTAAIQEKIDDLRYGQGDAVEIRQLIDELAKLSIGDAEQYHNKLIETVRELETPDDPLKRGGVKRIKEGLRFMRTRALWTPPEESDEDGYITLEGDRQNTLGWLKADAEFERWLKKNPEATDAELQGWYDEHTRPIRKEKAVGVWERFLNWRRDRTTWTRKGAASAPTAQRGSAGGIRGQPAPDVRLDAHWRDISVRQRELIWQAWDLAQKQNINPDDFVAEIEKKFGWQTGKAK